MSWKVQTGKGGKFVLLDPEALRSNILLPTDKVPNAVWYAEHAYHPVTSHAARRFDTAAEAQAVADSLNSKGDNA